MAASGQGHVDLISGHYVQYVCRVSGLGVHATIEANGPRKLDQPI